MSDHYQQQQQQRVQEAIDIIRKLTTIELELETNHDIRPTTIYNGVVKATHDYVTYSLKVKFENNRKLLPLLYNSNEHIIYSEVDSLDEIMRGLDAICSLLSLVERIQEQDDKEERQKQEKRKQLQEIESESINPVAAGYG